MKETLGATLSALLGMPGFIIQKGTIKSLHSVDKWELFSPVSASLFRASRGVIYMLGAQLPNQF